MTASYKLMGAALLFVGVLAMACDSAKPGAAGDACKATTDCTAGLECTDGKCAAPMAKATKADAKADAKAEAKPNDKADEKKPKELEEILVDPLLGL